MSPSFIGPRRIVVDPKVVLPGLARLLVEEEMLQGDGAVEG